MKIKNLDGRFANVDKESPDGKRLMLLDMLRQNLRNIDEDFIEELLKGTFDEMSVGEFFHAKVAISLRGSGHSVWTGSGMELDVPDAPPEDWK